MRILTRPEISELSALAKVFTAVFPHSQRLAVVVEETPLFIRICPPVRFTPLVMFQICCRPSALLLKPSSKPPLITKLVTWEPPNHPKAPVPVPLSATVAPWLMVRFPRTTPIPGQDGLKFQVSFNTKVPAFTVVPPV